MSNACSPCQTRARDLLAGAPEVPAGFWAVDEISDALASWHMGRVITAYRRHPHHPRQLPQDLVAGWVGITQAQLSRIENGPAPKDLDKLIQWAQVLRIPERLLWFRLPARSPTTERAPLPTQSGGPSISGITALQVTCGSGERMADQDERFPATRRDEDIWVNRRTILYGLVGGAVGAVGGAERAFADRLESVRRHIDDGLYAGTNSTDVDELERVAYEYAHDVGFLPPNGVLPELITDLDGAHVRLLRASENLHAGLASVCGKLSALMAITLLNLDEAQAARRFWRTAIRAVDQTPDRSLRALIRGRRAVFALYDRRAASTVLALADEAVAVSQGIVCTGAVSGYAARAQALALLGRHDDALEALRHLSTLFAQLPEETITDRRSQWGWSEQRLRHVESHVHSCAGRISDAASAQDAALSLYPPRSYQGPAQIELHRAICLIVARDPSEGARHVVRTISALPDPVRRDGIVRRTAALALGVVPGDAAKLPIVSEARDLLASPIGIP